MLVCVPSQMLMHAQEPVLVLVLVLVQDQEQVLAPALALVLALALAARRADRGRLWAQARAMGSRPVLPARRHSRRCGRNRSTRSTR